MEVNDNKLYWARVRLNAIIPTKRDEDAGYDIYACFDEDYIVIPGNSTKLVSTGIAVAVSDDYYIGVAERGSTGSKGIKYSCGVIDSGYRGEIFIALTNINNLPVIISKISNEDLIEKYCKNSSGTIQIPYENKKYLFMSCWDDQEDMWATVYPYGKAIAQLIVHRVHKMQESEITYEQLLAVPSTRCTGKLGSSSK